MEVLESWPLLLTESKLFSHNLLWYYSYSVRLTAVRKTDEEVEDLDEGVYCSIAVTKYMLYLGFNGVEMNPEHPKF